MHIHTALTRSQKLFAINTCQPFGYVPLHSSQEPEVILMQLKNLTLMWVHLKTAKMDPPITHTQY